MSRRKYADPDTIAMRLNTEGWEDSEIYKPQELIGITEMTKLIGKAKFEKLLSDLIVKPEGKPTLVPESDKRPAISTADSARSDFE